MDSQHVRGFFTSLARPIAARQICARALVHTASWLSMVTLLAACNDGGRAAKPDESAAGIKRPAAQTIRFVKLEEVTEWNGKPWASMAEFNLIDSTGATIDRKSWIVSADSAGANEAPINAIDGNPSSLWHTRWEDATSPPPHAFIVKLGMPLKVSGFRYLPRQDKTVNGTIAQYRFYVSADGVNWGEPVSVGDFSNMSAPTIEKTVIFAEQTANHPPVVQAPPAQSTQMGQTVSVQIAASDADGDPLFYVANGLPTGLTIAPTTGLIAGTPILPGLYTTTVSVSDNKGPSVNVALQWVVQTSAASVDATRLTPGEVRFVKLEELSEANGKPWASIAEFNLVDASGANLPRTGWTASADSADTSDKPGNAIDGNPASLWHSQWDGASPPPPHSFIIDMGRTVKVSGFRYLPRQDHLTNGVIAKFRFYTSVDGVDWGQPVAEGDFSTMGAAEAEKTVLLK